jgi:uncharacterized protein YndB with AHSA1/START domain
MNTGPVVRVSRRFEFPAEMVFDAWIEPGMARNFLFATPTGEMQEVEIDARVGGRFTIAERRPDGDAAHHGTYLEIERPRRLVFAYSTEPGQAATHVAIDIAPDGDDGCTLALVHELAPEWADYEARTREGWTQVLDTLACYLQTAT